MSLDALLNHKCNIYHLQAVEKQVGYGLPATKSLTTPMSLTAQMLNAILYRQYRLEPSNCPCV